MFGSLFYPEIGGEAALPVDLLSKGPERDDHAHLPAALSQQLTEVAWLCIVEEKEYIQEKRIMCNLHKTI